MTGTAPRAPRPASFDASTGLARARGHERLVARLPRLRRQLEQRRRFRLAQLAALRAAPDPVPAGRCDPGLPARREVAAAVTRGARQVLADIDDALARIAAGSYGQCQRCHRPIALSVLDAVPRTRHCLACQARCTPAGTAPEERDLAKGRAHGTR